VTKAGWAKSQSNRDAQIVMLLNRKNCTLTLVIAFGLVIIVQSNNWYQSQGHKFNS